MSALVSTVWVGLGGAVGSMVRYQLDGWFQARVPSTFPVGILVINGLGSFLLVLVAELALSRGELISPTLRLALTTGVLGGFTTYSTFNYDTLRLANAGAWGSALGNLLATVAGCLVAGVLGWVAARTLSTSL